jgi:hypothetical protein
MAGKTKNIRGEMDNVGGQAGATLTVIPENDGPGPQPAPVVVREAKEALPAKKVNLRVYLEAGWLDEKADTQEEATDRAEEIVMRGVWQIVQAQRIFHSPTTIHRVVVTG